MVHNCDRQTDHATKKCVAIVGNRLQQQRFYPVVFAARLLAYKRGLTNNARGRGKPQYISVPSSVCRVRVCLKTVKLTHRQTSCTDWSPRCSFCSFLRTKTVATLRRVELLHDAQCPSPPEWRSSSSWLHPYTWQLTSLSTLQKNAMSVTAAPATAYMYLLQHTTSFFLKKSISKN